MRIVKWWFLAALSALLPYGPPSGPFAQRFSRSSEFHPCLSPWSTWSSSLTTSPSAVLG